MKNPEEFQVNAARIEAWTQKPDTRCLHLDTLRDGLEYKKLNTGLLHPSITEQCIADIYAMIYESNAKILEAKENDEEKRIRMRLDNILASSVPAEAATSKGGDAAQDPMAMYKRKPTMITHREIIRRAEALMIKPAPIATPKPVSRSLPFVGESSRSPAIAVVIPQADVALQHAPREVISVPDSPLSVHDSADDESELTDMEGSVAEDDGAQEVEEDEKGVRGRQFPNLFGIQSRGSAREESSDVEMYAERPERRRSIADSQGDREKERNDEQAAQECLILTEEEKGREDESEQKSSSLLRSVRNVIGL